MNTTKKLTVVL